MALALYKLQFIQFYVQFINLWCTSCKQENTNRQVKRVFVSPPPISVMVIENPVVVGPCLSVMSSRYFSIINVCCKIISRCNDHCQPLHFARL